MPQIPGFGMITGPSRLGSWQRTYGLSWSPLEYVRGIGGSSLTASDFPITVRDPASTSIGRSVSSAGGIIDTVVDGLIEKGEEWVRNLLEKIGLDGDEIDTILSVLSEQGKEAATEELRSFLGLGSGGDDENGGVPGFEFSDGTDASEKEVLIRFPGETGAVGFRAGDVSFPRTTMANPTASDVPTLEVAPGVEITLYAGENQTGESASVQGPYSGELPPFGDGSGLVLYQSATIVDHGQGQDGTSSRALVAVALVLLGIWTLS